MHAARMLWQLCRVSNASGPSAMLQEGREEAFATVVEEKGKKHKERSQERKKGRREVPGDVCHWSHHEMR